jgi:hypothetical protein
VNKRFDDAYNSFMPKAQFMIALIKTPNPATISFAEAVLKDSGIDCFVMDQNMSVLEPGIMIPKRLMVIEEDEAAARRALTLAGLEKELV